MYHEMRRQRILKQPQYRNLCGSCRQPPSTCYCHVIEPVSLNIRFVILIHPIEARRRVATGRMSHLCLSNSLLLRGCDFSQHSAVNQILTDPTTKSMILYPGKNSRNLTLMSKDGRDNLCPVGKSLTVFVIDGTWATAKKMLRLSNNLQALERICFSATKPSEFHVRKQPRKECLSTIEAIHQTIELLGPSFGFDTELRAHDQLLKVFQTMVQQQLEFLRISDERAGPSRYKRNKVSSV
jgi:DTW domain-containing protein YfiP